MRLGTFERNKVRKNVNTEEQLELTEKSVRVAVGFLLNSLELFGARA